MLVRILFEGGATTPFGYIAGVRPSFIGGAMSPPTAILFYFLVFFLRTGEERDWEPRAYEVTRI